jgi:hypothetical protein
MADHAQAARKPPRSVAPARAAAPARRTAEGAVDTGPGEVDRLLNARPAVAAQERRAAMLSDRLAAGPQPIQRSAPPLPNRTGLPDRLKAGVEALSGLSMDDVRVYRNSPRPARLQAHAYAKGNEIHLAPGQERHLPHEAWHVVQQKRDPVRPTLRMSGVPVSASPALEAEADTMGTRAAQSLSFGARPRRAAFQGSGVVQAKLAWKGQKLDPLPADASATVTALFQHDDLFVMRDNSLPQNNQVQIIRADTKYLLGENHLQSRWPQYIEHWSVDTMREARKIIPELAPAQSPGGKDQHLDSMPAYALSKALVVTAHLNQLLAIWKAARAGDKLGHAVQLPNHILPVADYDMNELVLVGTQYKDYAKKYKQIRQTEPPADLLYFAGMYDTVYRVIFADARAAIQALLAEPQNALKPEQAPKYEAIRFARRTLIPFIEDVSKVVAPAHAQARQALKGLAENRNPRAHGDDYLEAANPYREAAMAANLRGARAPLLAKIGNAHIVRLAALVPNAHAVDKGVDFNEMTKHPKAAPVALQAGAGAQPAAKQDDQAKKQDQKGDK